MIKFNPTKIECKSIIGGIPSFTDVKLSVFTDENQVSFFYRLDKEKEYKELQLERVDNSFCVNINFPTGLYWYHFRLSGKNYGPNDYLDLEENNNDYELVVYDKEYMAPSINSNVIYQIFPDRFNKVGKIKVLGRKMKSWGKEPDFLPDEKGEVLNNDFFGGNFKGVQDLIWYLVSLNVSMVYLNPIYLSPSNHRYNISNYFEFDPMLGSLEDFKDLVESLHSNGIKIILDMVLNHTGDDSIYFNKYNHFDSIGAYNSKDSKYISWYDFERYPDKYASWWGITTLPQIKKGSPSFIEFVTGENGVLEYYMSLGVDGFRFDVIDELPNLFIEKINKVCKKHNKELFLLGEVWEDGTNKIAYGERKEYFLGKGIDSVMNYPLLNSIISFVKYGDASFLYKVILNQVNNYPKQNLNLLMNILGTHDTRRILNVLSSDVKLNNKEEMSRFKLNPTQKKQGIELLMMASTLEFTLPGIPSIYYGDEIGMEGEIDPFNRRTFNYKKKSKVLFNHYVKLSYVRKNNIELREGDIDVIKAEDGLIMFRRIYNGSSILVIANSSFSEYTYKGNFLNLMKDRIVKKINIKKNSTFILKEL